ncbi:hypothetical protein NDU88_007936 [Pleurodeles waltl]|uniref:Uncharacterized protein n=1 Tax=Pleurodeles waltl TaxID=8319 RepID=A0AAV7PNZ7_PLEWA|nr:hypothetical protein NDU88_007936 [Pleurodeles waltl]
MSDRQCLYAFFLLPRALPQGQPTGYELNGERQRSSRALADQRNATFGDEGTQDPHVPRHEEESLACAQALKKKREGRAIDAQTHRSAIPRPAEPRRPRGHQKLTRTCQHGAAALQLRRRRPTGGGCTLRPGRPRAPVKRNVHRQAPRVKSDAGARQVRRPERVRNAQALRCATLQPSPLRKCP